MMAGIGSCASAWTAILAATPDRNSSPPAPAAPPAEDREARVMGRGTRRGTLQFYIARASTDIRSRACS
jgi:hypothetical protein